MEQIIGPLDLQIPKKEQLRKIVLKGSGKYSYAGPSANSLSNRFLIEDNSPTHEESSAYQFCTHSPESSKEWINGRTTTAYGVMASGSLCFTSSLLVLF